MMIRPTIPMRIWPPGQPRTPPVALSGPPAAAAAGPDQDRDGGDEEQEVADPAGHAVDALLGVVARLRAVADRGAHEPPDRVAGHADGHEDQERLAERLLRDLREGALLVGRLAAAAERELDREHADDRVDHAARGDSGAGQPLELTAPREVTALALRAADRCVGRTYVLSHGEPLLIAGMSDGNRRPLRASCLVCDARRAAREHEHEHGAEPDQAPSGDVERVVHAAVHPGEGDEHGHQDRDGPGEESHPAVAEP